MNKQEILGIDIGNVITAGGNEVFTPDFLTGPAMPGAFEAIKKLVEKFGRAHVWLVSKCGQQTETRTVQWLEHHGFFESTDVCRGHVIFCRKRHEKAPICERIGITHFIDDRLEVLSHMTFIDPPMKLYLFKPRPSEVEKFFRFLPHVIRVESWEAVLNKFFTKDYSQLLIKEYPLWSVYAHENQSYLGRCYAWCRRKNARYVTNASIEEWHELHHILKMVEAGLISSFNPTALNYALLGNVTHHLHCHVIPRYAEPVEFAGMIFTDDRWGQNYLTDKNFVTPPEILKKIVYHLKQNIV